MNYRKAFPLVADTEPILGDIVTMELYDEADLISNIRGNYQDRFGQGEPLLATHVEPAVEEQLDLAPPLFGAPAPTYSRKERQAHRTLAPSPQKTVGQLAREASREDIKKKKSAAYLQSEPSLPTRVYHRPSLPVKEVANTRAEQLTRAAENLHQDSYILVDIPKTYSLEKSDRVVEKASSSGKNSYDFLKKSQVYNYPERARQRERQVAQELNLQQIEEETHG